MALTADALYIVCVTHQAVVGGKVVTVKEGDVLLGAKLPAGSEALVIAFGSTADEILARKRAAGVNA
jgi:hypothetical protein